MSKFIFTNGLAYSIEQLTDMHNQSFAHYFVPLEMTPIQMANFCRQQQVSLAHSVIMHTAEGELVGMAKVAIRGLRAYCAGFSIVPQLRGLGMGKLLVDQMIQSAREAGMASLQLEVLYQNEPAIRLYTRAGFQKLREVVGLQLPASDLPGVPSAMLKPRSLALHSAIPYLASEDRPVWGRELAIILTMDAQVVALTDERQSITKALVYVCGDQRVLIQAAVLAETTTVDELTALLRATIGDATTLQIYNEPQGSLLFLLARDLGFKEFFRQYDMQLDLQ